MAPRRHQTSANHNKETGLVNDTPRSANAELAVTAVMLQGKRDFDGIRSVVSPDVELDFPYHPLGAQIHRGVDAMIREIGIIKAFQTFSMEVVQVFDTGGDTVIVEARSRGTYRSNRPDYTNHYLIVLTLADGKVTRWREFYNPLEAMKQNYGVPPRDGARA